MKTLLNALFVITMLITFGTVNAQNTFPATGSVGIGTSTPNAASLLEVKSTTKGLLFPRMTAAQKTAIVSPVAGLVVYQTDGTKGLYHYNGSAWKAVAPAAWNLAGNGGTTASQFLGTTDSTGLKIRTKNIQRAVFDANGNFGIGTATPGAKLHVAGNIYNDGGTTITGAIPFTLYGTGSGIYTNTIIYNNPTDGFLIDLARTTNQNFGPSINFKVARRGEQVPLFFIEGATSYVGLGTSTPANKLHVAGATRIVAEGSNWEDQLNLYSNDGVNRWNVLVDNGASDKLRIAFNGGAVEVLSATPAGNIGIGTISPSYRLDVNGGSINTDSVYRIMGIKVLSMTGLNTLVLGDNANVSHVGVNQINPTYTFEVNGSAGKPGGGTWGATSDARLKQQVESYTDGLAEIMQIKPVRYHYNEESGYDTKPEYVGVLAQELKEVASYMVGTLTKNNKEYYSVDNSAMTYMLINAVKEQQGQQDRKDEAIKSLQSIVGNLQNENTKLKSRLDKFENALSECCTNYGSEVGNSEFGTSINGDFPKLEQNMPNPFKQGTVIRFYIPQQSDNASLKIFSIHGEELKSFSISAKGKGKVEIAGNSFSQGVYIYVLIIDGKTIDTKQMVFTK